jgi:type IV pilus assembly protein PilB
VNSTEIPKVVNPDFFHLLVSKGLLKQKEAEILIKKYHDDSLAGLIYLLDQNRTKKKQLSLLWGDSVGAAYVELEKTLYQPDIVHKIPGSIARKYKMIPVYQFGETITMATADPGNNVMVQEVEKLVGMPISPVFSLPEDIESALESEYHESHALGEFINKISSSSLFKEKEKITPDRLHKLAGNQAVVELPICIVLFAIKEGATDVHIEPFASEIRIRFKINGVLKERFQLDISLLSPLCSRLKTLAGIEDAKAVKPLRGRISFPLPNQRIELLYISIPTLFGEKIVLKFLEESRPKKIFSLEELYLSKNNAKMLKEVAQAPYGIFVVSGTSGAGITTTLYSIASHINHPEINIMSVEDPVIFHIEGINQIQTDAASGFDAVAALDSCLLHDPEVLIIGQQVNSPEISKIIYRCALSGRLVLMEVQANNSLQALIRLVEMGMSYKVISQVILGVLSQRLVRRLCDKCKVPYKLSKEEMDTYFNWDGEQRVSFYQSNGCPTCENTGFSGQIAIQEHLHFTPDIRRLLAADASVMEIQDFALMNGFETMRYDGFKKIIRGLTTLEEINRVTQPEESALPT